ncbi:MAG: helix-turn-helix transcriptional regulator [Alphaproteobacteria bacterium]|nr:helix-turn-helix transcriptional regulator [Alphaproteobacteria bacterium]
MEITAAAKKRLASLIEERGLPLAPLAAKIGVSQSTLWNFVYGGTRSFSKIHLLATELKISLDWILQGDRAVAHGNKRAVRLAEEGNVFGGNEKARRMAATLAARVARDYPQLPVDAVVAIVLAATAHKMKTAKAVKDEVARLAAYELSKIG